MRQDRVAITDFTIPQQLSVNSDIIKQSIVESTESNEKVIGERKIEKSIENINDTNKISEKEIEFKEDIILTDNNLEVADELVSSSVDDSKAGSINYHLTTVKNLDHNRTN
jgi:hypothetical protein